MATSTSLNLQAVLKTVVARSALDRPAQTVSGLSPSAKALYVASAAHSAPNSTIVIVVPGDRDLEQMVSDVSFFLAAIEGLSESAVERGVLPILRIRSHGCERRVPRRGRTS